MRASLNFLVQHLISFLPQIIQMNREDKLQAGVSIYPFTLILIY
jgi:hypothetical protein